MDWPTSHNSKKENYFSKGILIYYILKNGKIQWILKHKAYRNHLSQHENIMRDKGVRYHHQTDSWAEKNSQEGPEEIHELTLFVKTKGIKNTGLHAIFP